MRFLQPGISLPHLPNLIHSSRFSSDNPSVAENVSYSPRPIPFWFWCHRNPELELGSWLKVKHSKPSLKLSAAMWLRTGSFCPSCWWECELGVRTWYLGRETRWKVPGFLTWVCCPSVPDNQRTSNTLRENESFLSLSVSVFLKLWLFWFSLENPKTHILKTPAVLWSPPNLPLPIYPRSVKFCLS